MQDNYTPPNALCNTIAAIFTFLVLPAVVTSPVWIIYLFTRSAMKTVEYVLIGAFTAVLGIIVLVVILGILAFGIPWLWENVGEPVAERCQQHREKRRRAT